MSSDRALAGLAEDVIVSIASPVEMTTAKQAKASQTISVSHFMQHI